MSRPIRVLLVDDEALILRALGRYLRRAGFEVSTAHNGAAALDVVGAAGTPDWVITDVRMPVMDGPALVRALRGDTGPQPHILMITGHSALSDAEVGDLALAGMLQKPIDGRRIVDFIQGHGGA